MSAWSDFYKGRNTASYRQHVATRYAPFIKGVKKFIAANDNVVELGSGLATVTRILRPQYEHGEVRFHAFDNDADMMVMSGGQSRYADVRQSIPVKADVIHSHGVLEHLSDEEIAQVLEVQRASGARAAVHYVPGEKYEVPSFGDERLLSVADWKRIAKPTAVVEFNRGFDYMLVYEG